MATKITLGPAYAKGDFILASTLEQPGGSVLRVESIDYCDAWAHGPWRIWTTKHGCRLSIRLSDIKACSSCALAYHDGMMPSHNASSACQSGKRAHCTCDTCY